MTIRILQGDCRDVLKTLPDQSVNCCVTSPPYFGLRDYGNAAQIGLEPTPHEYVEQMVAVFREVRRVLRDDGTLWLNLGDSYAGSWGAQSREHAGKHTRLDQLRRKRGEVRALERLGGHGPDAAAIAGFSVPDSFHVSVSFAGHSRRTYLRVEGRLCKTRGRAGCNWLLHRVGVKVILRLLRKQENIFVRLGAAIRDALRHRVRLVPDDVLTQIPAVSLKCEGYAPRDADQVFGFESRLKQRRVCFFHPRRSCSAVS